MSEVHQKEPHPHSTLRSNLGEKTTHKKKKRATWQQTRNEGLLSTVQAHDKSPTWRSSTLITVSHIRETGDSTKKDPTRFSYRLTPLQRYGLRNRKIQRPTSVTTFTKLLDR